MKSVRLFFLMLFLALGAKGQLVLGYHPFQSVLSLSSNTERLVFADFKLETNNFASNLNMELSPKFNLKRGEWVDQYVGAGWAFNPANLAANLPVTNGYFVDYGFRFKPLAKQPKLLVVFEISPYVNRSFSSGNIRTRLGLGWRFSR